jgi:hypothetical protein
MSPLFHPYKRGHTRLRLLLQIRTQRVADYGRVMLVIVKAEIRKSLFEVGRCAEGNVRILNFSHVYFFLIF